MIAQDNIVALIERKLCAIVIGKHGRQTGSQAYMNEMQVFPILASLFSLRS